MSMFDDQDRPMAVLELSLRAIVHDGDQLDATTATVELQVAVGSDDMGTVVIAQALDNLADRLGAAIDPALRDILEGR